MFPFPFSAGCSQYFKKHIKLPGIAKEHVKLLGIEIDNKLKFDKHVQTLCQEVNKKASAFSKLRMYISREQALSICNVVIL